MLIPRIMPCLLLCDGGFAKTRQFKNPIYVGDPVNVINLFNRFEVDEIVILDIRATLENKSPDFDVITELANECWVPLSYGGGITSLEEIQKIFSIGVEKVILNTSAYLNPELIEEAVDIYGSQAIVGSIDLKKKLFGGYDVYIKDGTEKIDLDPISYAQKLEKHGVGEILLNSIDRDGQWSGYDLKMIETISNSVDVPVIACGGAGSRLDLPKPIKEAGSSAVAAGSLFVFQSKDNGVLINYPERDQLEAFWR